MKMKKDKDYIWAKICSYFSNELTETQHIDFKNETTNSEHTELINMINKDLNSIDKAAYMFEKQTDQAWEKMHNKILDQKRRRIFSFQHKPLLKIAASIVLLIGLSWISMTIFNQSKINTTQTKAFQTFELLPDGTKVYLNKYSKIEYPKHFSATNREVKLSGEAFFDVVKDAERPFIITANETRIEVLGTSFNVLNNINAKKVEVLVESGVVRVSNLKTTETLTLTKGQFGYSQNNILKKNGVNDLNYLSWKTKRIDFNEAPLSYVIDVLNKTYTSKIIIKNEVSSAFKLNAKFDKVPLDTVLKSICLAFNLEHKQTDNEIQLANKPK